MTRPAGCVKGALVNYPPKQQPDAVLSQANPVSATLYEVLPIKPNCCIQGISTEVTWAVTQPTPLEIVATIDGLTYIYVQANPVSIQPYVPRLLPSRAINDGLMDTVTDAETKGGLRGFMFQGRSIRVQVRLTWAVTQPTPLVCRVKWAKW